MKMCTMRKIIFCTGLSRTANAGQNSVVTARANQGRDPIIGSLVLSFNSRQGQPLSSLSGDNRFGLAGSLLNFTTS